MTTQAVKIHTTRSIKCPVCLKGKIIDVSKDIADLKINTHAPNESDSAAYFVKCPKCKSQIGISINK